MTIKELERKLNIRTVEDMEKEFQRLEKNYKKDIYRSIKAELKLFLEYKKATLKDKLIAANYFIVFRQARKAYKKNKSKELYPAWDYLANEEYIAVELFREVNKAQNNRSIKKVTDVMKLETEKLKEKTEKIKNNNWDYESEDEMRERLAAYAKKKFIESNINYRKQEDETRIRLAESQEKVKEAAEALEKEIEKCHKK